MGIKAFVRKSIIQLPPCFGRQFCYNLFQPAGSPQHFRIVILSAAKNPLGKAAIKGILRCAQNDSIAKDGGFYGFEETP